jgi:acylphosphatase
MPTSAAASPLVGEAAAPADRVRLTAWVRGRVQGVGFRWWVRCRALELGLVGTATNLGDGRVEVVAEGTRSDCERLLALLAGEPTRERPGFVVGVVERWAQASGGPAAQPPARLEGFTEK